MDRLLDHRATIAATCLALVVVLVVAQFAATASAPPLGTADAGRVMGRAGFAYLGGLRTFAAAVLWNRLEPQFHEYYSGSTLKDLSFLLPSLYLVQKLDPQFEQSYYNAAYVLADRGRWAEAYRVAEDGIRNNPKSGLLRANLVQLLFTEDKQKNLDRAVREAKVGLAADMAYQSPEDAFESLGIFRVPLVLAGDDALVAAIDRRQAELKAAGYSPSGLSHDHDGDGQTDH